MVELKRLVAEKTAHLVGVDYQLVHGRDTLEYDKTLKDYPSLSHGSTLQLLVPLPGGAEADIDPTLPRINDEPCMITKESFEENGTVVLMMPCGHPISPGGLMDYCWSELNANKTQICCLYCTKEWTIDIIRKFGGVSQEEFKQLEERINQNFCLNSEDIKKCSRCKSFCSRINGDNPRVVCTVCSKELKTTYHFCWHCLRKWEIPGIDSCGHDDCKDEEKLQQLKNSGKVVIQSDPRMEMYQLRACPYCGEIAHCTNESWRVQCSKCETRFCFVCLRAESQGSWFCGTNKVNCTLAPVQKKIPNSLDQQADNDNAVNTNTSTTSSCNLL